MTEALLWIELDAPNGQTFHALVRAMRWPPDGGDFGDQEPLWSRSQSTYGEIDARRIFADPPDNLQIAEIWPDYLFTGEGSFPVIEGEVLAAEWRSLPSEDPPVAEYRLSPEASTNCS